MKRSSAITVFAVFLPAIAGCGGDDDPGKGTPANVERFESAKLTLEAFMQEKSVPGMSVAVVIDGKLAFSAGLGVKSKETQEPVTRQTLFHVASMTKPIVAAAALDLVEDGKLDLQAPAKNYAPWVDLDSKAAAVSTHHALTHTSGVAEPYWSPPNLSGPGALRAWFEAHPKLPLIVPPGTLFNYTNTGFGMAATVLEGATGTNDFIPILEKRIMEPCGMASATFDRKLAAGADYSTGYGVDDADQPIVSDIDTPLLAYAMFEAAGGIIATSEDYAHFVESLLSDSGPLESESIALMTQAHEPTGWGAGYSYGYGLFRLTSKTSETILFHTGTARPGWAGTFAWMPEKKLGAAILANAFYAPTMVRQAIGVLEAFTETELWPDLSTPASEWKKYEGTFARPGAPAYTFEVSQDGQGKLWATTVLTGEKQEMLQGDPEGLHGGDTFHFGDFWAVFYPGPTGSMDYMSFGDWVAVRQK